MDSVKSKVQKKSKKRPANNVSTFLIGRNIAPSNRYFIAFGLMVIGILMQQRLPGPYVGYVLLFIGNMFLLIKGYDNRVAVGKFQPDAKWTQVTQQKLVEVKQMQKKMNQWDNNYFDITNGSGMLCFVLAVGLPALIYYRFVDEPVFPYIKIIIIDFLILVVPQFITGVTRIDQVLTPAFSLKLSIIQKLAKLIKKKYSKYVDVEYQMQLCGKKAKVPLDLKLNLKLKAASKDFIGIQGQVCANEVKGTDYPYFYMVLVAKKGFGLSKHRFELDAEYKAEGISKWLGIIPKTTIITEFQEQTDVEVLIIRQETTENSGYHTSNGVCKIIIKSAIKTALKAHA
ncbi:MAG: hypothetical protein ISR65_00950 [Bacteriovoracaceae bacterium]|nr:hypothetical protein [Bacteriovoracaceae bacterium]